jgi:hypothetical protein
MKKLRFTDGECEIAMDTLTTERDSLLLELSEGNPNEKFLEFCKKRLALVEQMIERLLRVDVQ